MAEKSQIAIYVSLGSLAISSLSFFFALKQSKIAQKNERLRIYDKVYNDACELLVFHYKNELKKPFESEDKDLEKAVNEFDNAHWLEQTYGFNVYVPEHIKSEKDKFKFLKKVREAYYAHDSKTQSASVNYQSPVYHLKNKDFQEKFKGLYDNVSNNLSYFSQQIIKNWEKIRYLNPDKIKTEYLALERINEIACESVKEPVDDPYLKLLLAIRHEYQQLNMPLRTKIFESIPSFSLPRLK